MHILGPLLYGRSRALCGLLGSFWTRNRSPVNPILKRAGARVGRGRCGQLSGGGRPNQPSSVRTLAGDAQRAAAEVLFAFGNHLVPAGTELVGPFIADIPGEVAARDL